MKLHEEEFEDTALKSGVDAGLTVEKAPENTFMVSQLIQHVWSLIDEINSAIMTVQDNESLVNQLKEVLDTQYIVLGQLEDFTPVGDK